MDTSTRNGLTDHARFFLAPDNPLHRQYEALRAFFVERLPSHEVARRFGYSPGAFRVLCHQFRHDADKRAGFFQVVQHGPRYAPARDPVRELVVAMRKRNLSVYDIQRELADAGHAISINALAVLLREEGFARLPRRRTTNGPLTLRPEPAAVADVRNLDLNPAPSALAWVASSSLSRSCTASAWPRSCVRPNLPGSAMIPAEQALRTLLALKLVGNERKSHVMDLVCDQGIALFAGLNVVPKRSYLASYSSRVDHRATARLMAAWFDEIRRAGLPRGDSFDLDFHTVPANTEEEPLEKHYISSRSRSQKGVLVFLARDATARVLCYAHAGLPKAQKAAEILRFVEFWQATHRPPARRTGLRFAIDHLRTPAPAEPAPHPLPDPAPPHPADARPHLEPAGLGLAAHHLAGADPHLPHAPSPGRTHPPARLHRHAAADHRHRPGPRGPDHPADQQHSAVARRW